MQAQFSITYVGGEVTAVTTSPIDMVRTEKYTGKSIANGSPTYTDLCYIAYSASRRAGQAGQDFENWLELVDSIDEAAEVDDPKALDQP